MNVRPEDVSVERRGESEYFVSVVDVPGRIEMTLRDREMAAVITSLTPPKGVGRAIGLDDVKRVLAAKRVKFGIDYDAINRAVEQAAGGVGIAELVIASGREPSPGRDARVEFFFRINGEDPGATATRRHEVPRTEHEDVKEFVVPGQTLAVVTPPEPPADGCTVTGGIVRGEKPKTISLKTDKTVTLKDDKQTYAVADGVMGYACFSQDKLFVEDPLTISGDKLRASIAVQPPAASHGALTKETVSELLASRGITHGIDLGALERAMEQAEASGAPLTDVCMAEGRAPSDGEDATIELRFSTAKTAGRLIEGTDQMDYKERSLLQTVKKDEAVAVKTPATEGTAGFTVFGDTLAAKPGKDKALSAAQNVRITEDGLELRADMDGVVCLVGGRVAVFHQYEVPGDVDYSTGNLSMDGVLSVKGWVRAGFTARASGDVLVGKGIEDAVVQAGGDLHVGGGIVGGKAIRATATGTIMARFVEGARLRAGGDVLVHEAIVRSTVYAAGRVDVTEGKGRIVGGAVVALKGLEVNELGSEADVKTFVSVGIDPRARAAMTKTEKDIAFARRNRQKIELTTAWLAQKSRQHTITRNESSMLSRLVKCRRETAKNEAKLAELKRLVETASSEPCETPPVIRVNRKVHSGTMIAVEGRRLQVKDDISGKGMFTLDEEGFAVRFVRQT